MTLRSAINISREQTIKVLIILLGIFISFTPPVDPDFGWHYKYGEYLFTNLKLLTENIYSFTLPNYQWHNTYWLSELLLFITHRYLGNIIAGLLFAAVLAYVCYKFIAAKTKNNTTIIFVFTILMLVVSLMVSTVRPLFFNIFFWLYLLEVLYFRVENRWLNEKYLPLLFAIWANTHAEFTLGLFTYGVYFLYVLKNDYMQKNFASSIKTGVLVAASTAATLINPYGINLYITLFNELGQQRISDYGEWTPIFVASKALFLPVIFIGAFAIKNFIKDPGLPAQDKTKLWYTVLLIIYCVLAIRSVYFNRVLIIFALPLLIDLTDKNSKKIKDLGKISFAMLGTLLLFYGMVFTHNIYLTSNIKNWSIHHKYPYDAVRVLKTINKEGNLFNWFNWGGYLIWQLPEYKTFVDGRMNAWKVDDHYFIEDYLKIHRDPYQNKELLNKYFSEYNIRYLLHNPESAITKYLLDNGWTVLYKNEYSILLERKDVFAYR